MLGQSKFRSCLTGPIACSSLRLALNKVSQVVNSVLQYATCICLHLLRFTSLSFSNLLKVTLHSSLLWLGMVTVIWYWPGLRQRRSMILAMVNDLAETPTSGSIDFTARFLILRWSTIRTPICLYPEDPQL